jgi:predicted outer membrane repeat protein
MRLCALLALAAAGAVAVPAHGTTHTVNVSGGADYTTIGEAVSAASEGDTILVYPGTYTGEDNHDLGGHGTNLVFLAHTDGRAPVIIDGGGTDRAFNFNSGQNATTVVHGFTIQNGYGQGGSGIRITSSSPTIENCVFLNNHAFARGGGIYVSASSSTIRDCVFRGNSAVTAGGAIYSTFGSSTTITGCLMDENTIPAASLRGAAIYCGDGSETVTYCTIVENGADQVKVSNGSGVDFAYCIIANSTEGVGIIAEPADGAWITQSVLYGNAGGDAPLCDHDQIIYSDPLFCDDASDDYFLCADSFAVAENNIWNEQIGAYGAGCDPCDTPVEPTSWARVKALYR